MSADPCDARARPAGWHRNLTGLALAVAVGTALPPITAQRPVFTTTTEAIWVTTTVIGKDGHLVTDLDQSDFDVSDNGVAREIVTFRHDVIPFALTIMLDLSGSMADRFATEQRAIAAMVDRFQPGDRVIVGGFETLPSIGAAYSSNPKAILQATIATMAGAAPLCAGPWLAAGMGSMGLHDRLSAHGATALWDGLLCGIVAAASDAETPRRVVLVVTDGIDTASTTAPADVRTLADQGGVMIYAVGMEGINGVLAGELRAIAERTGGGYFHLTASDDVIATFARIADELRHQYVFGVIPNGPVTGRHTLAVHVRRPDVTTRSRRVYLVTVPLVARGATVPPAPVGPVGSRAPPAPGAAPPGPSSAVLLDRFARGESVAIPPRARRLEDLDRWSTEFRRTTNSWIREGGPSDESRRRLAAATYILQVLVAQDDRTLWADQLPASALLEWAGGLLRQGSPEPAEDTWYAAALVLLERFRAEVPLQRHIQHAQSRFPADARWVLAEGICEELDTWPGLRDGTTFNVDATRAAKITARYTEAAALEPVRQEALLRLGFFELRRGHVDVALARFADAGEPGDVFVRYLLHLFRGRALEQTGRLTEAIAAYSLAASDIPFAQSAALALGAALVADHRGAEATALVTRTIGLSAPGDPWTIYPMPDVRFWPALMASLREAIKP